MRKYFTYGLNIHSNVELPLWPANGAPARRTPDVVIERLESHSLSREAPKARYEIKVCPNGAEFLSRFVGTIRLRPGRPVRVIAEPLPDSSEKLLAHFLSGSALAQAIHYHGFLPLHGCAVRIGEKTAIFMGVSGMGKSTLCAALCRMGHQIITDDISPICWIDGRARVMPGYPRVKLNPDVVDLLGIPSEELTLLHERHHKMGWLRSEDRFDQPQPIDALFILGIGEREILPLEGMDAFALLQRHATPSQWGYDGGKDQFLYAGRLIRETPFYLFLRQRNLNELMDQAEWACRFLEKTEDAERAASCC